MSDGRVSLRDLSQPESAERNGDLVSCGPNWAEVELSDPGAPIPAGTLVGFQTSQTIYVGHVDTESSGQRLRVRIDHWLAVEDVSTIQRLWSQDPQN